MPATDDPLEYETEGFSDRDAAPHTDEEVAEPRTPLERSRADLLDLVSDRPSAVPGHR